MSEFSTPEDRKSMKHIRNEIIHRLQRQGLGLKLQDLVLLVEAYSPRRSQQLLSYALDLVKPFLAGLGFVVRKLSDDQVVLNIDLRPRNQTQDGVIHPSVITAGAQEAVDSLLERHSPVAGFQPTLVKSNIEFKRKYSGPLTVHFQWDALEREKKLIQLQKNKEVESEFFIEVKDGQSRVVADVHMNYHLKFKPRLS